MSRMYTDEELCWATQVAYCNVNKFNYDAYQKEHTDEHPTLQEIFNSYENPYDLYFDQNIIAGDNEGDWLVMQNEAKAFIDRVKAGTICQGWRIVEVSKDTDQKETGFYAVTIQTGEEDAIVSFRGSEAVDINQFVEDWVVADFTMLGSEVTEQEELAEKYLYDTIQNTDYDNFAVTGHSLGGNLALVSTVMTKVADKENGTNVAVRIKQAVSFDGPGHPTEFIDAYRTEINEMAA